MRRKFFVIEKLVGETPLQALLTFKSNNIEYKDLPLTYAGRLDPMASGKLLILSGEECKKRKKYDNLDKEYEFEILLGVKSDTGDVLGLVCNCSADSKKDTSIEEAHEAGQSFLGKHRIPYPVFSSKVFKGKPLFWHALQKSMKKEDIPYTSIKIKKITFLESYFLDASQLERRIIDKINLLKISAKKSRPENDFRKDEVIKNWQTFFLKERAEFQILKFGVVVGTGTYIRSLAPMIAEKLKSCGLAFSIHRTKIGRYRKVGKNFGFWSSNF